MTLPNRARLPGAPFFAAEAVRSRGADGKSELENGSCGVREEGVDRWQELRFDLWASLSLHRAHCRRWFPGPVLRGSLKLQQKGLGEERAHPLGIEPRSRAGIPDEGDGPAHAELVEQIAQLSREARQRIEDMRQAHQEMVAAHRIPVEGKGMLVVVEP